jgi:hypothetical protein
MFEDLDWKGAFRRAAFAAALYLLFIYVMSLAFPNSFGGTNLVSSLIIAVAFFIIYAPVFAFAERRKKRRLAELNAQKKGKPGARAKAGTTGGSGADGEEAEAGDLRGRHNPNTSRKKAARRRRR